MSLMLLFEHALCTPRLEAPNPFAIVTRTAPFLFSYIAVLSKIHTGFRYRSDSNFLPTDAHAPLRPRVVEGLVHTVGVDVDEARHQAGGSVEANGGVVAVGAAQKLAAPIATDKGRSKRWKRP